MEHCEGLGLGGDVSLIYQSRYTSHFSSHHFNDNVISDYVSIEVSFGYVKVGYMCQETIQYFSHNNGFYRCCYQSGE